jgi:hypothetical protein
LHPIENERYSNASATMAISMPSKKHNNRCFILFDFAPFGC